MLSNRLLPLMTLALASLATTSVQFSEQDRRSGNENSQPIWLSPNDLQEAENKSWTNIDPFLEDTTYAEQFHVLKPHFSQSKQANTPSEKSISYPQAPFAGSGFIFLTLIVTMHGLRRRQGGNCKNNTKSPAHTPAEII